MLTTLVKALQDLVMPPVLGLLHLRADGDDVFIADYYPGDHPVVHLAQHSGAEQPQRTKRAHDHGHSSVHAERSCDAVLSLGGNGVASPFRKSTADGSGFPPAKSSSTDSGSPPAKSCSTKWVREWHLVP